MLWNINVTRCKISAVGYIYFTTIAMCPKKPVCVGICVSVCVCVCMRVYFLKLLRPRFKHCRFFFFFMRFKVLIDKSISISWTCTIFRKQGWTARQRLTHRFVYLCGPSLEQYSEPAMVNTNHQISNILSYLHFQLCSRDSKSGLRGLHNKSQSWWFYMEVKWGKEVLSSELCDFWIQPQLYPDRPCDLVHVPLHSPAWLLIFKRRTIIYQFIYFLQGLNKKIPVMTWHSKYSKSLLPQSNKQIPLECLENPIDGGAW